MSRKKLIYYNLFKQILCIGLLLQNAYGNLITLNYKLYLNIKYILFSKNFGIDGYLIRRHIFWAFSFLKFSKIMNKNIFKCF